MMKTRALLSILPFLAMASMSAGSSSAFGGGNDGSYGHGIPDQKKRVIPNGCKEYTFYGFTVIAISEASARKKCKRLYDRSFLK